MDGRCERSYGKLLTRRKYRREKRSFELPICLSISSALPLPYKIVNYPLSVKNVAPRRHRSPTLQQLKRANKRAAANGVTTDSVAEEQVVDCDECEKTGRAALTDLNPLRGTSLYFSARVPLAVISRGTNNRANYARNAVRSSRVSPESKRRRLQRTTRLRKCSVFIKKSLIKASSGLRAFLSRRLKVKQRLWPIDESSAVNSYSRSHILTRFTQRRYNRLGNSRKI